MILLLSLYITGVHASMGSPTRARARTRVPNSIVILLFFIASLFKLIEIGHPSFVNTASIQPFKS